MTNFENYSKVVVVAIESLLYDGYSRVTTTHLLTAPWPRGANNGALYPAEIARDQCGPLKVNRRARVQSPKTRNMALLRGPYAA